MQKKIRNAKMWQMNKSDYQNIILGSFFSLLSAVFGAVLPFLLGEIINEVVKAISSSASSNNVIVFPIKAVILNMLLMLLFGFFGLLFTYFGRRVLAKFSTIKLAEIRSNVFVKIQYLSPEDLKDHKDYSLLTRLQLDNLNYATYLNFLFITFIPMVFRFITFSIMCLWLNYIVALVIIGFSILFYIVISLLSVNAEKSYIKVLESIDKLNKIIKENITGARVVKAFNLKQRQRQRFIKINDFLVKTSIKAEKNVFGGWPFSLAFVASMSVIVILVFSLLTWVIPNNQVNKGEIISFINYSYLIIWSVFEFIVIKIFYARSHASKLRIQEIINLKNNHFNEQGVPFKEGDIIFNNVSFKYNSESIDYVLKNISFTIKKNTRVGIIGPIGSGKSTLINLITRLFDSQSGEIKIGGINLKDISTKDLINNISISFQQKYLFAGTIKSNILFGNKNLTNDEILELLTISEMRTFIDSKKEGINYKLEQNGQNLSGGQKQRIAIARALSKESKILIFDDATSALDNITEKKILQSINEIKQNITQIFVAQKISTIKEMDQIIVLDKGFIVCQGTHNDLIKSCNVYKEINEFQDKEIK